MRKLVYGIFMLAGLVSSLFATPSVSDASISSETTKIGNLTSEKAKDLFYFSDIVEKQGDSGFLVAHYSHTSHGSHGSHGSHTSHYSSRY